jgi:YD repeat-containing protein
MRPDSMQAMIRRDHVNGASDTYTYDRLNRLSTVTDASGATTYAYDTVDDLQNFTYPNGVAVPMTKYFGSCILAVALFLPQHSIGWGQSTELAKMHAEDDATWASRAGLSKDETRKLRTLAGAGDESSDFIDNVDAKTLAPYQLVLFATYSGSARCVIFWLFSKVGDSYKEFWRSEQGGDELNFCADPKCNTPIVKATPNRDIEVDIPSMHKGKCVLGSYGFLKWTGTAYAYKGILNRGGRRSDH